jgi:hypothetical protein
MNMAANEIISPSEAEEDLSLSIEDSEFARPLTTKYVEVSSLNGTKSSDDCMVCAQSIPKNRFTFLAQIIAIYGIIIVAAVNLSVRPDGPNKELWVALLASALGCVLPAPGLKYRKPVQSISSVWLSSEKK